MSQEVAQSAEITLNEADITNSNLLPPLMQTCQWLKYKLLCVHDNLCDTYL